MQKTAACYCYSPYSCPVVAYSVAWRNVSPAVPTEERVLRRHSQSGARGRIDAARLPYTTTTLPLPGAPRPPPRCRDSLGRSCSRQQRSSQPGATFTTGGNPYETGMRDERERGRTGWPRRSGERCEQQHTLSPVTHLLRLPCHLKTQFGDKSCHCHRPNWTLHPPPHILDDVGSAAQKPNSHHVTKRKSS